MVILRTLSQVDGAAPATPLGDRFEVDAVPLSTACAGCDIGLVLIGRAQGFFGRQPPRRLAAFQISPVLSAIPCSASSQAWNWASVIPGRTCICAASARFCSPDSLRGAIHGSKIPIAQIL